MSRPPSPRPLSSLLAELRHRIRVCERYALASAEPHRTAWLMTADGYRRHLRAHGAS